MTLSKGKPRPIPTKKVYINHELELQIPESMSRIAVVAELNKLFNQVANEMGQVISSATKARGGTERGNNGGETSPT